MTSVCIVHFGSPRNEDELGRFLRDIFVDNLPVPFFAGLFAAFAKRASLERYRLMNFGTASKISRLAEKLGNNVFVAAQYGAPSIEETLELIDETGSDRVIVLPFYPHASLDMYDSISRRFADLKKRCYRNINFEWTHPFYNERLFIEAWTGSIDKTLNDFEEKGPVHVIFSAHAHPADDLEYREQVTASATAVMKSFKNPWSVAFQSAMGGGRWSRPSLEEEIKRLAQNGVLNCIIVPVSFLFDNVETLFDIGRRAIPLGERLGMKKIGMAPPPGDSEEIVEMFKSMVCGL
jgi:ferrochelatase